MSETWEQRLHHSYYDCSLCSVLNCVLSNAHLICPRKILVGKVSDSFKDIALDELRQIVSAFLVYEIVVAAAGQLL